MAAPSLKLPRTTVLRSHYRNYRGAYFQARNNRRQTCDTFLDKVKMHEHEMYIFKLMENTLLILIVILIQEITVCYITDT